MKTFLIAALTATALASASVDDLGGSWSIRLTASETSRYGAFDVLNVSFENRGASPLRGSSAMFGLYRDDRLYAWAVAPSLQLDAIDLRPGERVSRTVPWTSLQFSGLRGAALAPAEVARAMSEGEWSVQLTLVDQALPAAVRKHTVWSNQCRLQIPARQPRTDLTGDYAVLQGRWAVTHVELETIALRDTDGRWFRFQGDRFHFDGDAEAERFTIDDTTVPKSIDFGDDSSMIKGIYKLEGDVLTLCTAPPGADRPTRFETAKGSGTILTVVRRGP